MKYKALKNVNIPRHALSLTEGKSVEIADKNVAAELIERGIIESTKPEKPAKAKE